ncbi:hypothetical protein AAEQ15_004712 [Escherichia coli]|nr:hypothetical protein [Escherichia coli]
MFDQRNGGSLNSLNSRHIQDEDLPKWLKNKIAALWFCLAIRKINVSGYHYLELVSPRQISGDSVCVNGSASSSHEIRLKIIRRWINSVVRIQSEACAKQFIDVIYKNWKEIRNKNRAKWLKNNSEQIEWAWEYVTKRIPDLHVTGFCPDNTEEKHIALLVLLNILNSEDKQSQLVSVCAEEDFCKKMHDAFRKRFIDGKKDKRVQINVKISPSAKGALDRLTRERKTTQQAILEQLILNRRLD